MKIFVTVGAQMPFDRLVEAVDAWIPSSPQARGFAQVGPGGYRPENMESVEFIEPTEYRQQVEMADLLVSHAGMGSIITALQYGKPIVIMPRRGHLMETRNDHQVATIDKLGSLEGIYAADNETAIAAVLDQISHAPLVNPISPFASEQLIDRLRTFING